MFWTVQFNVIYLYKYYNYDYSGFFLMFFLQMDVFRFALDISFVIILYKIIQQKNINDYRKRHVSRNPYYDYFLNVQILLLLLSDKIKRLNAVYCCAIRTQWVYDNSVVLLIRFKQTSKFQTFTHPPTTGNRFLATQPKYKTRYLRPCLPIWPTFHFADK